MNDVLFIIQGSFDFIMGIEVFGIPVIYIFIGLIVLTLLMNFIKGKKE